MMNELKFRIIAGAIMKEIVRRNDGKLDELDIDVIVSETIKVAGNRIEECPGPLGGFEAAVEYGGDVLYGCGVQNPTIGYRHVVEVMWGMPNWLCVTEQDCWDCMFEVMPGRIGELGNRNSTYLCKEDHETVTVRMDGLYAVRYKRNGATGWSDKSEERAKLLALKDLVERAGGDEPPVKAMT